MRLMHARLARAGRDEGGFALVTVLGVMLVVSLFVVAAFAAADGDLQSGGDDRERKVAYAAAEAGVNNYMARLSAQQDYWKTCASDTGNPALKRFTPVTSGAAEQYRIELLAANGRAACDTADPEGTFIDANTGTFRIRVTGRASATSPIRRSILVTFKRRGFLDYIYYTKFESAAPKLLERKTSGYINSNDQGDDIVTWGESNCSIFFRDGREARRWTGNAPNHGVLIGSTWQTRKDQDCDEIRFAAVDGDDDKRKDKVLGPFHTEDEIHVCGPVRFGRQPSDDIEIRGRGVSGTGDGVDEVSTDDDATCTGSAALLNDPNDTTPDALLGTLRLGADAPSLDLPPSNSSLKADALPAYQFQGRLRITMDRTSMTILEGKRASGVAIPSGTTIPLPLDGVIHVANVDDTCPTYKPLNPYPAVGGAIDKCGDVWISGNYARNVTINAENDIIITGDIAHDADDDVMLGLISNGWTRVFHPTSSCPTGGGGSNAEIGQFDYPAPKNITIQAAILAVQQSFTVDSFWCGLNRGTLNVKGAIGQRHRGPVGTGRGTTGFFKNYEYDDRLRFRSPPRFLDPVQSAWKIRNQVEQLPAANPTDLP